MAEPNVLLSGAIATVRRAAPSDRVSLRGDLSSAPLQMACRSLAETRFPDPREIVREVDRALLWMAPDELLIVLPQGEAGRGVAKLNAALAGEHILAADVSDARVLFFVDGPGARDALAKLTPADLRPSVFGPGELRRTRLAQVPAAIWVTRANGFAVLCFRSVAGYMDDLLAAAVAPGGSVGYF